ncbi:hypothetical protein M8C17_10300 [Micromonospora sp. RHAY321]|uniref:hypothetical protein n=1 Tax=Micromonospora sp. RHAY321 TaxID=2944807 RepID=UPI00207C6BEA|nr:hypothetical protein [Micromonospora sp. RHAY321]MCO1595556.1 hypothetical protein [Micromonospora sp. RHAY321]
MHPRTRTTLTGAGLATLLALTGCAGARSGGDAVSAEQSPSGTPSDSAPTSAAAPTGPSDPTPSSPAGRPSRAQTPLPTLGPPTGPPRNPTDARKANVLAGRITRGGDGPCYGLVTDDGRQYALHGTGMGTFAVGTTVRVTVGPADRTVDCGPGTPATIVTISPVG